jgi:cell division protein ZipA
MDLLRLSLIIIGFVIVVGLYIKFRTTNNKPSSDKNDLIPVLTAIDDEPCLDDFEALSQVISGRDRIEEFTKHADTSFTAIQDSTESGPESLLIVLNIMSPNGHVFTGEGIHAVMTSAGLIHGEHQIYHYLKDNVAIFSIANAVEPGFFDLTKLNSTTTPGLAVFLQLPGPLECRQALDSLLEVSKRLADALSGELCDENRTILSPQTISHLKEKVEEYRLKQQISQRNKRH